MIRPPPRSPLFPYPPLSRSGRQVDADHDEGLPVLLSVTAVGRVSHQGRCWCIQPSACNSQMRSWLDRKSTRLNSSHGYISYAVFCLKKKKKRRESNATDEIV